MSTGKGRGVEYNEFSMPTHQSYDVIVLGAGSAGFSAAEAAHKQGARVCIIEKEKLGGECPHVACVPSKAMLKVSKTLQTLRQARDFGLTTGGIETDFSKMMAYPKKVVQQITGAGTTDPYEKRLRQLTIDRVMGEGHFFDGQTLVVTSGKTETWLKAKAFVVATGSIPFIPSIEGIDQVHTLTFKDIWSLKHQPKSLAIIGGGPVGCEFATFFSAIGTHVTLIHSGPYVLHREDEEIARLAQEAMEEQGIEIITSAQVS